MIERIRIDSTAASPFKVSAAGVDVNNAQFSDLIFDGNQSPLRLWVSGYGSVPGLTYDDYFFGANIKSANFGTGLPTVPSGTTPIFLTMWRASGGFLRLPFCPTSSGQGGGGGGISGPNFHGANFSSGTPAFPTTPAADVFVNYAIFKNYQ